MVNAHFDSFLTSSGASDDGVGVSLMLEILRLMSSNPSEGSKPGALKNPVIFLFNGAEEGMLQGSHGFMTQHRWGKSVRALVNIEATGAGGRELMFQCNSPWIAQVYGDHVPYPHSSSIAHELFQSVLWRVAATDWRPIIEFGPPGIVGSDWAYIENGYVYHTSLDIASRTLVDDGTLMNTGSNLLQFVSALSSSPEIGFSKAKWTELNNQEMRDNTMAISDPFDSNFIFFDWLGLFQIVYTGWEILLIHTSVAVLALCVCFAKLRALSAVCDAIILAVYGHTLSILIGFMMGCIYALVAPMRWYAGTYHFASIMFVPPILLVEYLLRERNILYVTVGAVDIAKQEVSGLIYFTILLIISTLLGLRVSHIFLLWVFCGSLSVIFRSVFSTPHLQEDRKNSDTSSYNLAVEVVSGMFIIPAALCFLYEFNDLLQMLIPLLGKSGGVLNGDILIGLVYGLCSGLLFRIPVINPLDHIEVIAYVRHHSKYLRRIFVYPCSTAIVLTVLFTTFYRYPYSNERPKRLWIHHLDRDLTGVGKGKDSGLWIVGFDAIGLNPLFETKKEHSLLNKIHRTSSLRGLWPQSVTGSDVHHTRQGFDCDRNNGECYLYWPYYFPVAEALTDAIYIPTKPPVFDGSFGEESSIAMIMETISGPLNGGTRIAKVLISGPSHLTVAIRDGKGGKTLLRWGMAVTTEGDKKGNIIGRSIKLQQVPDPRMDGIHYIHIGFGKCVGHCFFRLDIEVLGSNEIWVSAYGHYVLMKSSEELMSIKSELPSWSRGAEWTDFTSKIVSALV